MSILPTIFATTPLFVPIFGVFIAVGEYIINTDKLVAVDTDWAEGNSARSDMKIYLEDDRSFFASRENAQDLLEWAKEATAKCEYCNRFDCNCGAGRGKFRSVE